MANAGKEFFRNRYAKLGEQIKEITLRPSIRINTLKTTEDKIIPRLEKLGVKLEKIPYTNHGYYFNSKFSLGAITEYLLGYYYLQEAAAQLPVEVLNPQPNDKILDCCAAPGGKTTQIAAQMKNNGTVIAYELKPHRMISLMMNLERCGVKNTTVFNGDTKNAKKFGLYDKILVDAPCSGNYVTDFRWFEKRTLEGIHTSSTIQKRILKSTIEMLKPNGILVYSTCSLEPEENELNIQWALDNFPVKLEKINMPIGDEGMTNVLGQRLSNEITKCKRFWPHKTNTEGFFIAKMVKK